MAVSWLFENPFFVYFRKHYCPTCSTELKTIKVSQIVNSNSPEAKDFDFSSGETYMMGDVKFIWTEFECPNCGYRSRIKALRKLEKDQERERKLKKKK